MFYVSTLATSDFASQYQKNRNGPLGTPCSCTYRSNQFLFDFQFLKIEFYPIFNSIQLLSIFKKCQQSKIANLR